LKKLTKKYR